MPADTPPIPGTEGYGAEAPHLLVRYEKLVFEDLYPAFAPLIPPAPAAIVDIGTGTGRDAAWFAARGYRVTAVEPTDALRLGGAELHPHARISWVADGLPDLSRIAGHTECYDVIWMSGVFMHLNEAERARAMPVLASLLKTGGRVFMSLRHGPVPPGRRMFPVPAKETIAQAAKASLTPLLDLHSQSVPDHNRRASITWTMLVLEKSCAEKA